MHYSTKTRNELQKFTNDKIVHDLPPSFHYITGRYLSELFRNTLHVASFEELIFKYYCEIRKGKEEKDIAILSLGCGRCEFEIGLARHYDMAATFTCSDLNQSMLDEAKERVAELAPRATFVFRQDDANRLRLDRQYDIIMANHSLHHFVELEHIFNEIDRAMGPGSFFLVNDMIGRNGHMLWDATLDVCSRIWSFLPSEFKYNHSLRKYQRKKIQVDYSWDGFEGIRAQDILPLLDANFTFRDFGTFFSLITVFAAREHGWNFDMENEFHKAMLDLLWRYDDHLLRCKALRPTQIMATMIKKGSVVPDYTCTYFADPAEIYTMETKAAYAVLDKPPAFAPLAGRLSGYRFVLLQYALLLKRELRGAIVRLLPQFIKKPLKKLLGMP